MRRPAQRAWRSVAAVLTAAVLPACTVLSTEDAARIRQRGSGTFNVKAYVADAWTRAQRELPGRSVPLDVLTSRPLDAFGAAKGNRAGEGSAWTFITRGEGVVIEKAIGRPRGTLTLATSSGPVILQVGPMVSGTAVRDALPFVTFNDVADQVAFAEVGLELTERALGPLRATLATIQEGDRVSFAGAVTPGEPGDQLKITPISLTRRTSQAGRA